MLPGGGGSTLYNGLYEEDPLERGTFLTLQVYLTIIPRARMGAESIAHEADSKATRARGIIQFSKTQLVGQKYGEKTTLAS